MMPSSLRKCFGFTLIEIMISLSILSIGILAIYAAQGNSLRASARAENIETAALLARQIMTQKLFDTEQDLQKGTLPDDKAEEHGDFEPPYDNYHWVFSVRKVEIPLLDTGGGNQPGPAGAPSQGGTPAPGAKNEAPANAQKSMAQIVTKKISENVRELNTKILWDELGEEQSMTVTTHISRLQ